MSVEFAEVLPGSHAILWIPLEVFLQEQEFISVVRAHVLRIWIRTTMTELIREISAFEERSPARHIDELGRSGLAHRGEEQPAVGVTRHEV